MTYIFDLDGTLIDTRKAVKEAYKRVGVNMPDEAWGKPWTDWLDDSHAHDEKAKIYLNVLKEFARPLPLYRYAQSTKSAVITGASSSAVHSITSTFGWLNVIATSCTHLKKVDILRRIKLIPPSEIIYVDDDIRVHEEIKKAAFICQVLTPEKAYQQLFPQPVPTRD